MSKRRDPFISMAGRCDKCGHSPAEAQAALAAAQAQAARLREALGEAIHAFHEKAHPGHPALKAMVRETTVARWQAALALPLDQSALDAVRAEERERCAKVLDERAATYRREAEQYGLMSRRGQPLMNAVRQTEFCAAAIRALGQP